MDIVNIISTLGFPIACCVALGVFVYHIYKDSVTREALLMSEIKETREINAKAVETIAHYTEDLGIMRADISEIKTVLMIKEDESND